MSEFANYDALRRHVQVDIKREIDEDELLRDLYEKPQQGWLFDVSVYQSDGTYWSHGPVLWDGGETPRVAARKAMRSMISNGDISEQGEVIRLRPNSSSFRFIANQSYMLWVTLENLSVKVRIVDRDLVSELLKEMTKANR
jgi:hypothetical protein